MSELVIYMSVDKTTKGAIRFSDKGAYPKTIYLRKEEAEKLGNPSTITVTIAPQ